jgi:hypothetical protein
MESSCARFKKASHNVPVMIPTFAFFCFNIHEIVQIRSLNLMYIRTILLYHPHSGYYHEYDENTKAHIHPVLSALFF